MSYAIAATHFNNRASFAIGAGELKEDRGALANGQAIGIGNGTNAGFGAAYWKDENGSPTSCEVHSTGASFAFNAATATSTTPYIVVARIEWNVAALAGKDRVSVYRFTDGNTLLESTFNSGAVSISADLDQSAFDTISLQGARYQVDELRVGTTFADLLSDTGGTLPEPLEITDFLYHAATDQFTLTWKSNPGYIYGLHWSDDLVGFMPDFNHAIPAHPTARRTTFGPFANPNPGGARCFLRVGPPDLTDPALNTVRGNGNRITLTFSEAMYAGPATQPANYTLVKDGGGAVHVAAADFGSGPHMVILTTGSVLELNSSYTLCFTITE